LKQTDIKNNVEIKHELAGKAVDAILKASALRRSGDNLTAVFVGFQGFFDQIEAA
jgi:hypothetical protein